MKQMSAENVQSALIGGTMQIQGVGLTKAEIRTVSEFVTGKTLAKEAFPKQAYCADAGPTLDEGLKQPHWNGWGIDSSNDRFQPAAMAKLSEADIPRLQLKWAFGFPGDARAYAQPAIVGGRVYVGSQGRRVYSLNASSGCIYWVMDADFPVRTAITLGRLDRQEGRWAAYFGDQHANAYAVDAMTGATLWKTRVNDHPLAATTGAPTLFEGRLYVPASSGEEVAGGAPGNVLLAFSVDGK